MSGKSSHQRWLALLAAGGVATGGVVALTSNASATTPGTASPSTSARTAAAPVAAPAAGPGFAPLLAQTKQLSDEIAAARKRLAALGGSTTYVTSSPSLAGEAAQLAAERRALASQEAQLVQQERSLQAEARKLAAEAKALAAAKPPTHATTGASGSGGDDGGHDG